MFYQERRKFSAYKLIPIVVIHACACTKGAPPASLLDSATTTHTTYETLPSASSSSTSNETAPDAGTEDLQTRAKKLFEAIQKDEPALASSMFLPRDTFMIIKDLKDPSAAWDKIFKKFKLHIHMFHKKLGKKAIDAEFETLELNTSSQVLVALKKESNKVEYPKVTQSKLRYKQRGKSKIFTIATMIQYNSKWYVLQLGK